MEEAVEALAVAGHHVGKAADAALVGEEQAEHGARLRGGEGDAFGVGGCRHAIQQAGGFFCQRLMEAGFAEQVEGGQPCRHGHRVTGQGACLIDRAQRCQVFHDGFLAAKGAHRHTATDDLAQGGHVRGHIVERLGAAQCHPEAGHDFVEDQHAAVVITVLAQGLQERLGGRHAVHVAGHRLDDDGGNLVAVFLEGGFHAGSVVVIQHQGIAGHGGGDAR